MGRSGPFQCNRRWPCTPQPFAAPKAKFMPHSLADQGAVAIGLRRPVIDGAKRRVVTAGTWARV